MQVVSTISSALPKIRVIGRQGGDADLQGAILPSRSDSQPTSALTSISVVIVAFQSHRIIDKAIRSAKDCDEIICVDNASNETLDDRLAEHRIIHVRNDENVGYGRACNRGAQIAKGEFILFMNPDVELAPGAVDALARAIRRYPGVDVFVPRTLRGNGRPYNHALNKFSDPRERKLPKLRQDAVGDCCVRFVDGGVFLIRRSTFLELGGFDERIFLYYEDDDLSLRLITAGHTIIYVYDANAVHRAGTSSHPVGRHLIAREFHKKRSEVYFNAKYGRQSNIGREMVMSLAKLVFYTMTLRPRRTVAAYGRLLGTYSLLRGRRLDPTHGRSSIR